MYPVKAERLDTEMKRNLLSKEYVNELNEHRYVEKATEWSITFTEEFKRLAYEEYCRGKSMRDIFTEAGFDTKKLGKGRLQNFRNKLICKADEPSGFADKRKDKSQLAPQSTEAQMMQRIRELEHRNAYLEQENEFLKKIHLLEEKCGGKTAKRK